MINLAVIFVASLCGSIYGTLIGGASLITIPTLILLGLPPHTAIGTDRLGVTGMGIVGWYQFHKKKMIDYRVALSVGIPVLFGAFLGANLALKIEEAVLKTVIAVLTLLLLPIIIFNPKKGIEKTAQKIRRHQYLIGGLLSLFVGVYAGFYGVMSGTFLCYVLILWFDQTFIESAANFKIGSLFSTGMAAIVFAMGGAVHYPMAIAMFSGSGIGSYIGVHYSDRIGNVWIRRFFIAIVLAMIVKLLLQR
jgi:uncharacterized protein